MVVTPAATHFIHTPCHRLLKERGWAGYRVGRAKKSKSRCCPKSEKESSEREDDSEEEGEEEEEEEEEENLQ